MTDFVAIVTLFQGQMFDLVIRQSCNPTAIFIEQIGSDYQDLTVITNSWKLGDKTACKHSGKFNHKSEDCRIAKNKLQKEVKPTGLTSLKGLKVSPFNESEN